MRPLRYSVLFLFAACGRTTVFFPEPETSPTPVGSSTPPAAGCSLLVGPNPLNFGNVAYGQVVAKSVTVTDRGTLPCHLSGIAVGGGSDPGFYVSVQQSQPTTTIAPGASLAVSLGFAPQAQTAPFTRTGTLLFASDDPKLTKGVVPLSATILGCSLNVSPTTLDFGAPAVGAPAQLGVTLYNDGGAPCSIQSVELASGTDRDFTLGLDVSAFFTVPPSSAETVTVTVTFENADTNPPYTRLGELDLSTGSQATLAIPLIGHVPRCALGIVPQSLDFGNILLNQSATDRILLFNDGGLNCDVSSIALVAGSDADFSIPASQPTSLVIPAGAQGSIAVTFDDLSGASEPFLRQGLLDFATGDPTNPQAQVPLSAFVNTACLAASQWIYTVDGNGTFSRFDPQTLTFTDIGSLNCPSAGGPFSMAVDQNAVAWVVYQAGQSFAGLYQVSTSDASCQATNYLPPFDQDFTFGMSFLFQPSTGIDTLYVALTDPSWTLATISIPALQLNTVDQTFLGAGELAGTGDGELWDFLPSSNRQDGFQDAGALLAQLDPATGSILDRRNYPGIQGNGASFCMKFWGGSFWVFLDGAVEKIDRNTGQWTEVIADTGRNIVGAGVSTCAPIQQQP